MKLEGSIGIDIGLEARHVGVVLGNNGVTVTRKAVKFSSAPDELESFVSRFSPDVEKRKEIAVLMEPTSNAWVLLAAYFQAKGFRVYIVKTQKSHALREFIRIHVKTDHLDAMALAKLPFSFPEDICEYVPPSEASSGLERLIKARETIMNDISDNKRRIYAYFQLLNPFVLNAFGDSRYNRLALAFYERYANPLKAVVAGRKRFDSHLSKKGYGIPSPELLNKLYQTCEEAATLHNLNADRDGNRSYCLETQAKLVNLLLEIISALELRVKELEKDISARYKEIDPHKVLEDIRGFGGEIIAPGIISLSGPIKRFPSINKYLGFIGLVPRISQSSTKNTEGMKITKAGKKLLKKYYCMAAETARQWDVEAAECYKRCIDRGKHHNQAICAVANLLARRVYAMLKRKENALLDNDTETLEKVGYELRDLEGKTISKKQAREIILKDYPSKKVRKQRSIMEAKGREMKKKKVA